MTLRSAPALLSTVLAAAGCLAADAALAHGTMTTPASRVYACFQGNPENPTNPACAAAKAVGGSQAFYDWNGINQANANGNHQAVVPDGKLCSGNNPTFRGLDLARSDWQTTPIQPDANGRFTFVFKATAPHATRDWRFFVTREGWQPGSALRWADLQEFCTLGNTPLSADGTYKLQCTLPQRSGQHVIYNTWQRSDSTEAFYTCMDVRFEGGSGGGGTPAPQWQDAGPLTARGELPVGTTLALRVFNAGGNDVERVEATLASGQTAPGQWPLVLARKVNASAQQARAGVLRDGVITPVASATENRVFLKPGQRFQLDTRLPDTGTPTPGGEFDHVYPAGIGSYVPGQTVVKGSDGKLYACRPFPQGGWCNVSGEAYRPGVGSAWRDAWVPY